MQEIGRERGEKIGEGISKAKSWLSSKFKSGFSGMKKLGFGLLATPEAIGRGTIAAGKGIGEGGKAIGEAWTIVGKGAVKGVAEGAKFMYKDVGVEAVKDLKAFDKYTDEKMEQFGNWAGYNTAKGYAETKKFISEKHQQGVNIRNEHAQLVAHLAFLGTKKTVEGLVSAKDGIVNRWNGTMEWGKNTIAAAQLKMEEAKQRRQDRLNQLKAQRAEEARLAEIAELKQEGADYEEMEKTLKEEKQRIADRLKELEQVERFAPQSKLEAQVA